MAPAAVSDPERLLLWMVLLIAIGAVVIGLILFWASKKKKEGL